MTNELLVLIAEALSVYLLVLAAHALRGRFGLAPFYALLGGLTAVMSWVTDAGLSVHVAGLTFMVGSAVFYTSLLLGVFVVYVFDGPRATRVAIGTVASLSVLIPLVAFILHAQMSLGGHDALASVPIPRLRMNVASVVTAVADLVFLAVAWEYLGQSVVGPHLWLRTFFTLLGVMWLDVVLFATGAFAGTPGYLNIMAGTLTSRLIITLFACPLLYQYLNWQQRHKGVQIENRPVLAILREVAEIRVELNLAQQEIARRKQAEAEKAEAIATLEATLQQVQRLEGLLPICSSCRLIRVSPATPGQPPRWIPLETYLHEETPVMFSHGICPECQQRLYPGLETEP